MVLPPNLAPLESLSQVEQCLGFYHIPGQAHGTYKQTQDAQLGQVPPQLADNRWLPTDLRISLRFPFGSAPPPHPQPLAIPLSHRPLLGPKAPSSPPQEGQGPPAPHGSARAELILGALSADKLQLLRQDPAYLAPSDPKQELKSGWGTGTED